jgi:hypothetical protein
MKTITMNIDEETLLRAEQKAVAMATSINEVVADYLRQWADSDEVQVARAQMSQRFAERDWHFSVGKPDTREQRNARS